MPEWDAEVEVDAVRARALIAARFPGVDVGGLRRLGVGWDNTAWLTGDGTVFRFPRRAIAVPGVEREIAVLPWLAPRLPAPIPSASHVAAPGDGFPWPWFGSPLVPGVEIVDAPVVDHSAVAAALGCFLRALHGIRETPPMATPLAVDPLGRADMMTRVPRARAALDALDPSLDPELGGRAARVLAAAADLPAPSEVVLLHGDLNLRHALVDDAGRLSGVIDWGDLCRGPRSVDLPLYWSLLGPGERSAFAGAYGPLDVATLLRARVLALFMDATLAVYARDTGHGALERAARAGIERTLVD